MINKHLLEIDTPTWTEYMMWDVAGYVKDVDYYFNNAEETPNFIQYNQLELEKKYCTTLCTLYGAMASLATRTGYDFSLAEREELIKLRMAESDFDEAIWGYTSRGVDVVRRYWNTHHPENPVVSFSIYASEDIRKKLFAKDFPIVTSFRGNSAFSKDANDGVVDGTTFGKTTFGHCRSMMWMTVYDNYKPKEWRRYKYKSIDQFYEVVNNWYERPQSFIFFLEKDLSGDGKKLVDAMKKWLWNGERENDLLTRFEASRIALRISQGKVEEKNIWNGKNIDQPVSKFEFFTMLSRASKDYTAYLWTDRNKTMTRKQAILSL